MDGEHPLFILYTSGSTGKPKGVLHTTAGYLLFVSDTIKCVFDYHDETSIWCTADIGWITGHTLHRLRPAGQRRHQLHLRGPARLTRTGPLLGNRSRSTGVTILYTAPTAIRSFIKRGDEWVDKHD